MAEQRKHTGASGQMAVMAELLFRLCNAAISVIDVGTDVFAFLDDEEELARIQVKTAQGKRYKKDDGYSAVFHIPRGQLNRNDNPPLYYALAVRLGEVWGDFIIISRTRLRLFWNAKDPIGTEGKQDLVLTIQYRPDKVLCRAVELTSFRNAWKSLPLSWPLTEGVTPPPAGLAAEQHSQF